MTNCQTCKHKEPSDGGHCYMFRFKPEGPCAQHSIPVEAARAMRLQMATRTLHAMQKRGHP